MELVRAAGSAQKVINNPGRWAITLPRSVDLGNGSISLWNRAREQLGMLRKTGGRALSRGSFGWPEELNVLKEIPAIINIRGSGDVLRSRAKRVTIIGARACTPYGRAQAERFGAGVAAAGAVVISGGARGIDQAAMRGALDVGGRVIAVVGSGLDRPYPPESWRLYDRIVEQGGAILSEFCCGMAPQRGNFPRRNRIMAVLAHSIVVVQATRKSGTFSTLGHVEDWAASICAIPGPVDCAVSAGPNYLIQEGCRLVQNPEEVMDSLSPWTLVEPDPEQDVILSALDCGDRSVEDLALEVRKPHKEVAYRLSDLELEGRVSRLPGGLYHRCKRTPRKPPC
jgi:DNA processing protein